MPRTGAPEAWPSLVVGSLLALLAGVALRHDTGKRTLARGILPPRPPGAPSELSPTC